MFYTYPDPLVYKDLLVPLRHTNSISHYPTFVNTYGKIEQHLLNDLEVSTTYYCFYEDDLIFFTIFYASDQYYVFTSSCLLKAPGTKYWYLCKLNGEHVWCIVHVEELPNNVISFGHMYETGLGGLL